MSLDYNLALKASFALRSGLEDMLDLSDELVELLTIHTEADFISNLNGVQDRIGEILDDLGQHFGR